ncbi:hypothetical protein [Amycolatopsis jejuensis]|uniref:hypothetical protein n=1 Tax=Amycolatopsis jejuensis TaxID=330084 RepID=UPI00052797B4|nr:hypothetical protein [Amycolatopsis jejuensis]
MTPEELSRNHFRQLTTDPEVREEFVTDPRAALRKHFGTVPDGDYRVESIDERPGLITILLPPEPADHVPVFDLLYANGTGGFLIPDEDLTWVVRGMRSSWLRAAQSP